MSNLNSNQTNPAAQIIKLVLTEWTKQNMQVSDFFSKNDDDFYLGEIAPGRNRAIYILGHLAAVNDGIIEILGVGQKLHPELHPIFLANPDKTFDKNPTINELKQYWNEINTKLSDYFSNMTVEEWMSRHTRVSEEDFAKEPHRNKLSVLINRTTHQASHMGQLTLMKLKEVEA